MDVWTLAFLLENRKHSMRRFHLESQAKYFKMRFALGEGQMKDTARILGRDLVSLVKAACQGNVYKQAVTGPGWGWS